MTATSGTPDRTGTPVLGPIAHVALTVRDLAVSVPWYRELIGSDPVLDEDTGPFRHVVFDTGGALVGLHQFPEGIEDLAHSARRPGMDHLAFGCADREELMGWQRRLDSRGVPNGGIVDAHYGSALSFRDPDGLPLELFCPPAG